MGRCVAVHLEAFPNLNRLPVFPGLCPSPDCDPLSSSYKDPETLLAPPGTPGRPSVLGVLTIPLTVECPVPWEVT